jgi:hypothetical protein
LWQAEWWDVIWLWWCTLLGSVASRMMRPHLVLVMYIAGISGHAVAPLVEALRYQVDGSGFDSRWCHCNFSLT